MVNDRWLLNLYGLFGYLLVVFFVVCLVCLVWILLFDYKILCILLWSCIKLLFIFLKWFFVDISVVLIWSSE